MEEYVKGFFKSGEMLYDGADLAASYCIGAVLGMLVMFVLYHVVNTLTVKRELLETKKELVKSNAINSHFLYSDDLVEVDRKLK